MDGQTFSFALMALGQNPKIFQTNVVLQDQWKAFGFDVVVDSTPEWPVWIDRYTKGDFDAGVMSWGYGADPDGLTPKFSTDGETNGGGYSNPELDALLEEGRTSLDQDTRAEIYSELQAILADDLPVLWLGWGTTGIIMKDKVIAKYDPMKGHFGSAYWWQLKE
jgi:peptide/nickel transport system substrate-binding protein